MRRKIETKQEKSKKRQLSHRYEGAEGEKLLARSWNS